MTNPTSNFGWQMPTPVDLVTDLPADFEVFGQAVDTAMADLKGGTTGQILAKATNTDMDFAWITNDVGDITGITATSPLTGGGTSGAVTVGILSGTTSNLGAVQLSTSTSSTSTSLAATASAVKEAYDPAFTNNYYAGKNKVINGDFGVWQRGTNFVNPSVSAYTADRWFVVTNHTGGTVTMSRQAFTGTDIPVAGAEYYFRTVTASPTGQSFYTINQKIENVQTFANQTVTLSFYAKADAARNVTPAMYQLFGTGGSSATTTAGTAIALTTSWARYTQTFTIPSITGKTIGTSSSVQFEFTLPNNIASSTFEFYGIQIEAGSVATPFQTATGTIQGELAACQRYYYRTSGQTYGRLGSGIAASTTTGQMLVQLPVTMRTNPASVDFSTLLLFDTVTAITVTNVTLTSVAQSRNVASVDATVAAGLILYRPYILANDATTAAYIGFSAEL
jgi:hypothetical protein